MVSSTSSRVVELSLSRSSTERQRIPRGKYLAYKSLATSPRTNAMRASEQSTRSFRSGYLPALLGQGSGVTQMMVPWLRKPIWGKVMHINRRKKSAWSTSLLRKPSPLLPRCPVTLLQQCKTRPNPPSHAILPTWRLSSSKKLSSPVSKTFTCAPAPTRSANPSRCLASTPISTQPSPTSRMLQPPRTRWLASASPTGFPTAWLRMAHWPSLAEKAGVGVTMLFRRGLIAQVWTRNKNRRKATTGVGQNRHAIVRKPLHRRIANCRIVMKVHRYAMLPKLYALTPYLREDYRPSPADAGFVFKYKLRP